MASKTITPFAEPKYTQFDNDLLDYIMPRVSGTAWKLLSFIIRQTWGWADKNSLNGRKEWDQISYSQYRRGTGIKSDATIKRGLDELLELDYILRRPAGKQEYEYRLNTVLEIEVEDAPTKNVGASPTGNVGVQPKTPTKTVDTKESIKERRKKSTSSQKNPEDDLDDFFPNNGNNERANPQPRQFDYPFENGEGLPSAKEQMKVLSGGQRAGIAEAYHIDDEHLTRVIDLWAAHLKLPTHDVPPNHVGALKQLVADEGGSDIVGGLQILLDDSEERNPDFHWKTYSSPYQDSFQNDLLICIRRWRNGQSKQEDQEAIRQHYRRLVELSRQAAQERT